MGWSSGSDLFRSVMEAVYPVLKELPAKRRAEIGEKIIVAFVDHDWDNLEEGVDSRWPWVAAYIQREYPEEDSEE